MILDLRGNPGGYLHVAVEVASQFVSSGTIVTEKSEMAPRTPSRLSLEAWRRPLLCPWRC